LDGGFGIVPQRGEIAEVVGGKHALADGPALALVDPKRRRQPRGRECAEAGKECADVGVLTLPPLAPQEKFREGALFGHGGAWGLASGTAAIVVPASHVSMPEVFFARP